MGEEILQIDLTQDNSAEGTVELQVEPSKVDFVKLRQEEKSKSKTLVESENKLDALRKQTTLLKEKLKILRNPEYHVGAIASIETFFKDALDNVSAEQDRSVLIKRGKMILESKILSFPLRVSVFNFANDYKKGIHQKFDKLKDDALSQKNNLLESEIKHCEKTISENEIILATYEQVISTELQKVDDFISKKKDEDTLERLNKAKQKVEDAKTKLVEEAERQDREHREEKERLRKLKEVEERKEREEAEAKAKAENDRLLHNLKSQGYSSSTSSLIDETTKLPQLTKEQKQLEMERIKVKKEQGLDLDDNDNDDTLEKLRQRLRENDQSNPIDPTTDHNLQRRLARINNNGNDKSPSYPLDHDNEFLTPIPSFLPEQGTTQPLASTPTNFKQPPTTAPAPVPASRSPQKQSRQLSNSPPQAPNTATGKKAGGLFIEHRDPRVKRRQMKQVGHLLNTSTSSSSRRDSADDDLFG